MPSVVPIRVGGVCSGWFFGLLLVLGLASVGVAAGPIPVGLLASLYATVVCLIIMLLGALL